MTIQVALSIALPTVVISVIAAEVIVHPIGWVLYFLFARGRQYSLGWQDSIVKTLFAEQILKKLFLGQVGRLF